LKLDTEIDLTGKSAVRVTTPEPFFEDCYSDSEFLVEGID
jgi:hypothetical protein